MKGRRTERFKALTLGTCLALGVFAKPVSSQALENEAGLEIVVEGRLLVGPGATAERTSGHLVLPLLAVAKTLGDSIVIDGQRRMFRVTREDGARLELDLASGEVRENGSPILVTRPPLVNLAAPNNIRLPSQLISALFGVDCIYDRKARRVRILRQQPMHPADAQTQKQGRFDLQDLDYEYNNSTSSQVFSYNLRASSSFRAYDGLGSASTSFSGGTARLPFDLQFAQLSFARPSGQRFRAMDFSAGDELPFLSSPVRGLWYRQPIHRHRQVVSFIGATPTGGADPDESSFARYRGFLVGSYANFGKASRRRDKDRPFSVTAGGFFSYNRERLGGLVAAASSYRAERWQLNGDLGLGLFSGSRLTPLDSPIAEETLEPDDKVSGAALAVDLSGSYRPLTQLRLQAQVGYISENFLPAGTGIQRPTLRGASSVSWSPLRWLSTSLAGRWAKHLVADEGRDLELRSQVSITAPSPWPSISFEHTQTDREGTGSVALTELIVNWRRGRYRLMTDLVRMHLGSTAPLYTGTLSASVDFASVHSVRYAQLVSGVGSHGGTFDWSANDLFKGFASFGAGFGYQHGGEQTTSFGRLLAQVQLPYKQKLRLSYTHEGDVFQLFASLGGPLYEAPGKRVTNAEALKDRGALRGRVYQDRNLNRRFDEGDKPQADVEVSVASAYFVRTGKDGRFEIANLTPGKHRVSLNILTVRAELTFLGAAEKQIELRPGHDVAVDFRLARTGQITGVVWIDANGNGKFDEGEEPVSDVRIVTSNRDTLTDGAGEFILGELVPGEHTVLVDEKTLPDDVEPIKGSRAVRVEPGKRKPGADLPMRKKPIKIEVKEFPPTSTQPSSSGTDEPGSPPPAAGATHSKKKPPAAGKRPPPGRYAPSP